MSAKPPNGQTPFQRGERLTAAKLNEWVTKRPTVETYGHGHTEGGVVVVDERETMHVRLTGKDTANTPIKYSWKRVSREANGTWTNLTHTGNTTNDYAVEINNTNLTVNTTTVYKAERSVSTGEWLLTNTSGGSGGNVTITSGETAIMILGTYEDYKDCPNVPASPPTTYANYPCDDTRTTTLCVPAYAYAVYNRCGYVWNKVGDTRTFQVWANELNGGTISAFRRFYVPRWGGDIDPVTGLPDPDAECMGLAVLGYNSQSTLTCSCPTCISSMTCLRVKFRTTTRPDTFNECGSTVTTFDNEDLWDKEITIDITGGCSAGGTDSTGVFYFEWQHVTSSSLECDWGPDVFDPCDPCAHWGRLFASITIDSDPNVNCGGAGHWQGEFNTKAICELLCNCGDPVSALVTSLCDGCGNNVPPIFYFIDGDSVTIECCPP